ncbi:nucleotidyltransferase domain-containing protein [Falsibacillus albus]|uniref:Nucleotidyltransferase domain-containing protein n=1 Tax=Falsibacillus albus TaxID=2478915 RepID=A0A3L7JUB2_9BACI|nr:nucleotidyltransferase domain-containing protein [Falsibacillus albus]RLQ94373.1 nucleotidyltransferase domain-containing protein [Falsibacillus albus]
MSPLEAAKRFIDEQYSECSGAMLAGSVVRGEQTETSDLDIVIFVDGLQSAYRESVIFNGWPIEMFVHSMTSYEAYFKSDYDRARPSLQRMLAEGIIIKDFAGLEMIKKQAEGILDEGPAPWTDETIKMKQYFITDALDDFIGSNKRSESIFIASSLADQVHEFILRTNRKWIGASKWIVRALRNHDEGIAHQFVDAFDKFYVTGEKDAVIEFVNQVLEPFGGSLFAGFSMGKQTVEKGGH